MFGVHDEKKLTNVTSLLRICEAELEEESERECEQQTRRQLLITSPLQTRSPSDDNLPGSSFGTFDNNVNVDLNCNTETGTC